MVVVVLKAVISHPDIVLVFVLQVCVVVVNDPLVTGVGEQVT